MPQPHFISSDASEVSIEAFREDPGLPHRLAVFIVSGRPRSGKTTVCAIVAALIGAMPVESSSMVTWPIEQAMGLERGTIERERLIDAERYRPEMIKVANAMAAEGNSPGLLCVKAGHRLIDGMRRVSEVEDSQAEARSRGLIPVVLFVENPKDLARVNDNTESAGLRRIANAIIVNDSTVEELRYKTAHALGSAIKKAINS